MSQNTETNTSADKMTCLYVDSSETILKNQNCTQNLPFMEFFSMCLISGTGDSNMIVILQLLLLQVYGYYSP